MENFMYKINVVSENNARGYVEKSEGSLVLGGQVLHACQPSSKI